MLKLVEPNRFVAKTKELFTKYIYLYMFYIEILFIYGYIHDFIKLLNR